MKMFLIDDALLSMQGALLDTITPELRAVIINVSKDRSLFYIRFYYDGEVAEDILELWNCACTEASAGLWGNFLTDETIERLDYPTPIPFSGRYVYLRKEGPIKHAIDHFLSRKFIHSEDVIENFIHPVTEKVISTTVGIVHDTENGNIIIPAKPKGVSFETEPAIAYALIAVERALLGIVTPELRSVIVDVTEEDYIFYFAMYYHGKVAKDILALWEFAITKASADLGSEYVLNATINRLDYPGEPPFRGRYAYLRKESEL